MGREVGLSRIEKDTLEFVAALHGREFDESMSLKEAVELLSDEIFKEGRCDIWREYEGTDPGYPACPACLRERLIGKLVEK